MGRQIRNPKSDWALPVIPEIDLTLNMRQQAILTSVAERDEAGAHSVDPLTHGIGLTNDFGRSFDQPAAGKPEKKFECLSGVELIGSLQQRAGNRYVDSLKYRAIRCALNLDFSVHEDPHENPGSDLE